MPTFSKRSPIDAPPDALFAYHENPGAFRRLNPPWEPVEIVQEAESIQDGSEQKMRIKIGPVPQKLEVRHQGYIPGAQFQDQQTAGPFADWLHTHRMLPDANDESRSILEDTIEYRLPLGPLGQIFGGRFAHGKLRRMFNYRHAITAEDMRRHQTYADQTSKKIGITGASGLIGSQLAPYLTTAGHTVCHFVRGREAAQAPDAAYWKPSDGKINAEDLAGLDALVHLAGASIAEKRWTPAQKRRIMESRDQGTRLLAETIAAMPTEQRPKVVVSASAIGYYGDGGDTPLAEDAPPGDTFQARVCQAWEAPWQTAIDAGVRVVILRIGVVLAWQGGALKRMLLPFQLGIGGPLGDGQQYFSWVALDDVLDIIYTAIMQPDMHGVYNASAPQPVTNAEFTRVMGRVLQRPTVIPVPPFGLRLLFGELADELLLASLRVVPQRLEEMEHRFRYPDIESALRQVLGHVKQHD